MKRPFTLSLLVAAALAAGCATTPEPAAIDSVAANAAGKGKNPIGCVQDTGSRIKQKPGDCRGPGRSYSRDELDRTGAIDTAEALKRLDPSL
jgi:hypothetical protein